MARADVVGGFRTGGSTASSAAMGFNPFSVAMIGLNILSGRKARKEAKKRAKKIIEVGRYNANIARQNAEQEAFAITLQQNQLARQQRKEKAQQRLSITSRGGALMGGSDLVAIMDQAQIMQRDQLELGRQKGLARIYGDATAEKIMLEARAQAYGANIEGRSAQLNSLIQAASYVPFENIFAPKESFNPNTTQGSGMPFGSSATTYQGQTYRGGGS
jgi:hypothetical protein